MKRALLIIVIVLAALARPSSSQTRATQNGDTNARIAVLESKVEALSGEFQKLQQKIDALITHVQDLGTKVQDLNTKMNLVLIVGSILFGVMITQVAGALSGKRSGIPPELEQLRIKNVELTAHLDSMRAVQDMERKLLEKDTELLRVKAERSGSRVAEPVERT